MIEPFLVQLSNSKIFGGCLMLLTNIGTKYLLLEFPDTIDKMFTNYYILRYTVLFAIFFLATRDIKISVLLTLFIFIIIKYFLNEKSHLCLIKKTPPLIRPLPTKEEYVKAAAIVEKYKEYARKI